MMKKNPGKISEKDPASGVNEHQFIEIKLDEYKDNMKIEHIGKFQENEIFAANGIFLIIHNWNKLVHMLEKISKIYGLRKYAG